MEKSKRIETGITGLTIRVNINDAINISMLLAKVDEYEAKLAKYNEWLAKRAEIQDENAWYEYMKENPEPEDPNAPDASWSPMEFITKAKSILRQLTFINLGESNVFDEDWMKSSDEKVYARKSYE